MGDDETRLDKPKTYIWRGQWFGWFIWLLLLFIVFLALRAYPTFMKGGTSAILISVLFLITVFIAIIYSLWYFRRVENESDVLGELKDILKKKKIPVKIEEIDSELGFLKPVYFTEVLTGKNRGMRYIVGSTEIRSMLYRHYRFIPILFQNGVVTTGIHSFLKFGLFAQTTILWNCRVSLSVNFKTQITSPTLLGLGFLLGYSRYSNFDIKSDNIIETKKFIKRNKSILDQLIGKDTYVFVDKGELYLYDRKKLNAQELANKLELMFQISENEAKQ